MGLRDQSQRSGVAFNCGEMDDAERGGRKREGFFFNFLKLYMKTDEGETGVSHIMSEMYLQEIRKVPWIITPTVC